MLSNIENFKEVQPISTFGSIDALTGKDEHKWVPKHVYALKDSCVITFRYKDLKEKIGDEYSRIRRAEDSEFLKK